MPNKLPVWARWPVICLLYAVLVLVLVPTWIARVIASAGLWVAEQIGTAVDTLTD